MAKGVKAKSPYSADEHTELKKYIGQGLISAAEQFDRAILALSGGAFGVSIAFLKDVAPHFDPCTRVWIISAWAAFLASISVTMFSFQASTKAFQELEEYIEKQHFDPENAPVDYAHWWNGVVGILNYVSLSCFVAGGIFLATFSYQNLKNKEINVQEKESFSFGQGQSKSAHLREGSKIISPTIPATVVPLADASGKRGAVTVQPAATPMGAKTITPAPSKPVPQPKKKK
jgi:hypothetical protein